MSGAHYGPSARRLVELLRANGPLPSCDLANLAGKGPAGVKNELAAARRVGDVKRTADGGRHVIWYVPEHEARAMDIYSARLDVSLANKRRYNAKYTREYRRNRDDAADLVPVKRRVVNAADVPAPVGVGPASVFHLAAFA